MYIIIIIIMIRGNWLTPLPEVPTYRCVQPAWPGTPAHREQDSHARCRGFEPSGASGAHLPWRPVVQMKSNKSLLFINMQSIQINIFLDKWAQEGTFKITINIK